MIPWTRRGGGERDGGRLRIQDGAVARGGGEAGEGLDDGGGSLPPAFSPSALGVDFILANLPPITSDPRREWRRLQI